MLNSNTSSTCPDNLVNFGLLTAEICWQVGGTPAYFNGFRVLAALLHGTLVVGISQTLRRWTEGASYILLGGHHVGHWPTFLVCFIIALVVYCMMHNTSCDMRLILFIFVSYYVIITGSIARSASLPLLWPPYVIGGPLYFCPVVSFHLLSSSFFSSPNLSGHRLDLYHTSTHGVALVRI